MSHHLLSVITHELCHVDVLRYHARVVSRVALLRSCCVTCCVITHVLCHVLRYHARVVSRVALSRTCCVTCCVITHVLFHVFRYHARTRTVLSRTHCVVFLPGMSESSENPRKTWKIYSNFTSTVLLEGPGVANYKINGQLRAIGLRRGDRGQNYRGHVQCPLQI